jgi:hypothetical protein
VNEEVKDIFKEIKMRKDLKKINLDKLEFKKCFKSRRTLHRDLAKFFFSCSETELWMFLVLAALPDILMDGRRVKKKKENERFGYPIKNIKTNEKKKRLGKVRCQLRPSFKSLGWVGRQPQQFFFPINKS